jgi:hypothetical protein
MPMTDLSHLELNWKIRRTGSATRRRLGGSLKPFGMRFSSSSGFGQLVGLRHASTEAEVDDTPHSDRTSWA